MATDEKNSESSEKTPTRSDNNDTENQTEKSQKKGNDNSNSAVNNSLPKKSAFVHKLYAMLSDPKLSHLIWWSRKEEDGVFALHPGVEFANALTSYFKHGNVSSFVRQLHMYGFHKVFDNTSSISNDSYKQVNDNNDSTTTLTNANANNTNASNTHNDDLIWEFKHSTGNFRKGDEAALALIKRRSSNKLLIEDDVKNTTTLDTNNAFLYPPQGVAFERIATPPPPPPHTATYQYTDERGIIRYLSNTGQELMPASSVAYYQPVATHPFQPQPRLHHQPSIVASPTARQEHQHHLPLQTHHQQLFSSAGVRMDYQTPSENERHSLVYDKITDELAHQQRMMTNKSDYFHKELRSTVLDIARLSDTLPRLTPALRNSTSNQEYSSALNHIQQSFNSRAESFRAIETLNPYHHQAPVSGSLPSSQQWSSISSQSSASTTTLKSHNSSQRQSIRFWESSGQRHPSVFLDPLHPSPSPEVDPSSSSSSRSSGTLKASHQQHVQHTHLQQQQQQQQQHPQQEQHSQPHQHPQHLQHHQHPQHLQPPFHHQHGVSGTSVQMRNARSVPQIEPLLTHASPAISRRNESLPVSDHEHQQVYYRLLSKENRQPTPPQRQPPRSLPDETESPTASSIPNISHFASQLRPSVLEMHLNTSHLQSNKTSLSSTSSISALNSAVNSTQTSFSSYSPRNSFNNQQHQLPEQLPTSPHHLSQRHGSYSLQRQLQHHHHNLGGSKIEEEKNSKLSVSSLLSSSPGAESSNKRTVGENKNEESRKRKNNRSGSSN